ncbi:MAG: EamA family transporter [Archangium sp.]|nr:EamA family transporter [Archangium sp.]
MSDPKSRTWFAFFTVIAAWGSSYLFIRLAVASFTPVGLVMTRFGLASLLCAGIAIVRQERFPRGTVALRFATVGMLMMTGSNALTAFAQGSVSSGITGVVHSLGSVWLAALGSLGAFGAELPRTPRRAWWGVAGGVGGVVLLLWPADGTLHGEGIGIAALLLATFLFAGASVLQRRTQALGTSGLFSQLAVQMAGGAGLAGLLSLHFGVLHAPITVTSAGAIAVLTVFASVAGFAAFAIVLRDWPPARAGTFGVVNPVVAVLLGVVVLHEPLTLQMVLGAVVTLGSVAWVQRVTT